MRDPILKRVSVIHQGCCLVSCCSDEGCVLDVSGWSEPRLAVIGGTRYQRAHNFNDPLCDFTLFGRDSGRFVCAVEMKGGRNLEAKHAIQQIQGGLTIAEQMFGSDEVDIWHPILLCHGYPSNWWDIRFLSSGNNVVEFHGQRKRVELQECGTSLNDLLQGEARFDQTNGEQGNAYAIRE